MWTNVVQQQCFGSCYVVAFFPPRVLIFLCVPAAPYRFYFLLFAFVFMRFGSIYKKIIAILYGCLYCSPVAFSE